MSAEIIWLTVVLGVVAPLLGWLLWWWNDIWYGLVMATFRSSEGGTKLKLPPGHMGLPIIGEMLTFLWYFKFLGSPDDYINSKRRKYGDGVGMYRTHLFGRPSVIMYLPEMIKLVYRSDESFKTGWPNLDLVGKTSLAAVQGKAHLRIRSFILRSANHPDALHRIAIAVQPRMISALQSWANRGRITCYKEMKKVTFENIGMYFASFEPGPTLDRLGGYFDALLNGFRSYSLNIPGTQYYHALQDRSTVAQFVQIISKANAMEYSILVAATALDLAPLHFNWRLFLLQCRKKAIAIFKDELEKRKVKKDGVINDLMDGLMNLKDEEGQHLSEMEVLDNIIGVLIAGFETTALSTMWAIYFLAKYPNVLQKLRDENMSLNKSKSGPLITSDEIFKLKYTMKVVDETVRMANLIPFVFRTPTKDVTYEGYTIPKGWSTILLLRYLHTDPENFQDPMCFNPDRWDTSMAPGTNHVFGGGSRTCAGNMLARLQIAMFLHYLSTRYKWELTNPDAKVKYLPYPKPEDGVEITIEKR